MHLLTVREHTTAYLSRIIIQTVDGVNFIYLKNYFSIDIYVYLISKLCK